MASLLAQGLSRGIVPFASFWGVCRKTAKEYKNINKDFAFYV